MVINSPFSPDTKKTFSFDRSICYGIRDIGLCTLSGVQIKLELTKGHVQPGGLRAS